MEELTLDPKDKIRRTYPMEYRKNIPTISRDGMTVLIPRNVSTAFRLEYSIILVDEPNNLIIDSIFISDLMRVREHTRYYIDIKAGILTSEVTEVPLGEFEDVDIKIDLIAHPYNSVLHKCLDTPLYKSDTLWVSSNNHLHYNDGTKWIALDPQFSKYYDQMLPVNILQEYEMFKNIGSIAK